MTDPVHIEDGPSQQDESITQVALATQELVRLCGLAEDMHTRLGRLQQDLAVAHWDTRGDHGARLREANGQLVQAALLAQSESATALESMEALCRSSHEDPLTGLPNRNVLLDRLEQAIAMAHRHAKSLAVLFFDVDRFKHINDTLGHKAGDEVLQRIAGRLKVLVRESDTVCRYGGDEFVVLLLEVSDSADAIAVVEKALASLAVPESGNSGLDTLSASAGIAVFPQDGEDPATLIKHADAAMYVAKRAGGGQFALHGSGGVDASDALHVSMETLPRDARLALAEHRSLCEANTQLLLAALQAQTHEADAREDHRRQIQYMAMVAHELRNPLGPIRTAASLLDHRGTGQAPSLPRLKAIIERQVLQITRLVEDLMEGSRVSTGKLRLERVAVDMADILELSVESCRPAMEARGQRIALEWGSEPLHMDGDPVRLVQVFCNLLDNASKYTPRGGEIQLSAGRIDDVLTVKVIDNGAGISPKALPEIFELFVQDDHALELDSRGMGIGLAVVRELVNGHGGNITAHSDGRNKGSTFVVTLPMAPAKARSGQVLSAPGGRRCRSGTHAERG